MALVAGSVVAKFKSDLAGFREGIADAKSGMNDLTNSARSMSEKASNFVGNLSENLTKSGQAIKGVGTGLSIAVTAPLVLLAKQAEQSFGEFNASIARSGAFVNATEQQLNDFRDAAIAAAKGTSFSLTQVADALGAFVGGEISAEEASAELGNVIDLALVTKMTNLQDVANLAATALTVFAREGVTVKDVSDEMATVAANVTTETDRFATAFSETAGSARAAGLTFKDNIVLMSQLVSSGANVNFISSAMNRAFVKVQEGGKQMTEMLATVGMTSKEMQDALRSGPVEFMSKLKEGFDKAEESGNGFLFLSHVLGAEAAPEFAIAMSQPIEKLKEVSSWFDETSGASDELIKRVREAIPPLERMRQTFEQFAVAIGPSLDELFRKIAERFQQFVDWFKQLSPETQKWIVNVGALAAILGPILVIVGTFVMLLGFLTSTAGLVVLAVMGIVGVAVLLWQVLQTGIETVEAFAGLFRSLFNLALLETKLAISRWSTWLQEQWHAIVDYTSGILSDLPYILGFVVGQVVQTWVNRWNALVQFTTETIPNFFMVTVPGWFETLKNMVIAKTSETVTGIQTWWSGLPGKIGAVVSALWASTKAAWNSFTTNVMKWAEDTTNAVVEWFKDLPRRITEAIKGGAAAIGDTVKGLASKFVEGFNAGRESLQGFATGGSFTVGGVSGIDRNVVAFRATRGEQVTIGTPGQAAAGVVVNLNNAIFNYEADVDRVADQLAWKLRTQQ